MSQHILTKHVERKTGNKEIFPVLSKTIEPALQPVKREFLHYNNQIGKTFYKYE